MIDIFLYPYIKFNNLVAKTPLIKLSINGWFAAYSR